jgi:hypothetical protein
VTPFMRPIAEASAAVLSCKGGVRMFGLAVLRSTAPLHAAALLRELFTKFSALTLLTS